MQKNPINSIYLIALALASLVALVDSLYVGIIYTVVVVLVFLLSISVVSMFEKIADKNVKFLIYILFASTFVIILKVVTTFIDSQLIMAVGKKLDMAIVPCILLSIIPIYLEDSFTAGQYFVKSLLMSGITILMFAIYSIVVEILGLGTIAGVNLGFEGLEFFTMSYGRFIVIGLICILFNIVRRAHLKRKRRFNMLVERYKIQIREIRSTEERKKGGKM